MCFELVLKNASSQLHELLLVDCSIHLGQPQRRLCHHIPVLSVEQYSQCWTQSEDESVLDHCCTLAQNQ